MEKINAIMKNINAISKIPFKICNELGDIYISPSFVLYDNCVEKEFHYLNEKFKIIVNNEDSNAISLLIYCIENSIGTAESDKNDIVDRIVSGNTFEEDEIKKEFPLLMQKMYVMMIYIDGSNQEAYELIKECYDEKEIIVVKNEEKIIILGLKKDINEHALSIRDTLNSNVAGKIIISYTKINGYKEIYNAIKKLATRIEVSKKYDMNIDILDDKDVLFEEIIDNIAQNKKKEIRKEFSARLKKINNEMIKTIEVFFKKDLNVSEAAKELFIHRNTLIYRLEKVQKYLGFDIRNFNEAIMCKILLTILKEKSN